MSKRACSVAAIWCMLGAVMASAYSIPEAQLDKKKVFWGSPRQFENPAEVQYETVVKATPEYQEIQKKKIKRGTGRYWLLLSQASERVVRTIREMGSKTDYDLIAAQGYLGGLDPPIPANDITEDVIEAMVEESKD